MRGTIAVMAAQLGLDPAEAADFERRMLADLEALKAEAEAPDDD